MFVLNKETLNHDDFYFTIIIKLGLCPMDNNRSNLAARYSLESVQYTDGFVANSDCYL